MWASKLANLMDTFRCFSQSPQASAETESQLNHSHFLPISF